MVNIKVRIEGPSAELNRLLGILSQNEMLSLSSISRDYPNRYTTDVRRYLVITIKKEETE